MRVAAICGLERALGRDVEEVVGLVEQQHLRRRTRTAGRARAACARRRRPWSPAGRRPRRARRARCAGRRRPTGPRARSRRGPTRRRSPRRAARRRPRRPPRARARRASIARPASRTRRGRDGQQQLADRAARPPRRPAPCRAARPPWATSPSVASSSPASDPHRASSCRRRWSPISPACRPGGQPEGDAREEQVAARMGVGEVGDVQVGHRKRRRYPTAAAHRDAVLARSSPLTMSGTGHGSGRTRRCRAQTRLTQTFVNDNVSSVGPETHCISPWLVTTHSSPAPSPTARDRPSSPPTSGRGCSRP